MRKANKLRERQLILRFCVSLYKMQLFSITHECTEDETNLELLKYNYTRLKVTSAFAFVPQFQPIIECAQ